MSKIISQRMFILTDAGNNNNKFWEATLHENGDCLCRWGRVGADGQSKTFAGIGSHGMESKIREKTSKGYREIAVIGKTKSSGVSTVEVKSIAEKEIAGQDPELKKLITRLAEANRHQILTASGGQMDLDLSTGIISTPLGVVTQSNIDSARDLLLQFNKFVKKKDYDNPKFLDSLNAYMMYVPQKVGSSRGWHHDLFRDDMAITRQATLLDQLEASVQMAEQQMEKAKAAANGKVAPTFGVKLSVVTDKKVIDAINKFYNSGVNRVHASRHLKPVRVYEVEIASMKESFDTDGAKLGNIQRLWHGTRVHNVLSIMKSGLIIPKSSGSIQITGRMFGDGLYFSDQATKSLNYSYGYWDGGSKDDNCFMFLADVAMGKIHTPSGPTSSLPKKGYDSTFAEAGKSGVMNNEMIVYRTSQANLRYLIEFAG